MTTIDRAALVAGDHLGIEDVLGPRDQRHPALDRQPGIAVERGRCGQQVGLQIVFVLVADMTRGQRQQILAITALNQWFCYSLQFFCRYKSHPVSNLFYTSDF